MPLKNMTKIKYPGLSVKQNKTKEQFKNLKKREKCVLTQFVSMNL